MLGLPLAQGGIDPTLAVIAVVFVCIFALIFVAAANLGTAVAGVYSSSIGLRHFPALQHLHWPALLLISILPVGVVGLFIPDLFFANFGTFLAFIGLGFAPLCGIQITDYYLLRGRRVEVRGLFEAGPGSTYAYWGGFNPASIAGMVLTTNCLVTDIPEKSAAGAGMGAPPMY